MADQDKPNLSEIADDFALEPVPEEPAEREDPRTEEGDSRGALFRRRVRSFVMADLHRDMQG